MTPVNGFFGRLKELGRISELLQEARLVTIAGPGGCGKTRLAQEVARSREGESYFADLSVCTSESDVVRTIAGVFGIHETGQRGSLDGLIETLRQRSLLLIVDNCEHVIGAVAAFARIVIRENGDVRLLATSREVIDVAEERVVRLRPLEISSAVDLFMDRAAEHGSVPLDELNPVRVRDICQRLDALPFAIEIAASALRMMSPDALAEALDERLVLPSFRLENTSKRRRNLRSLIEWSVGPLSMDERLVLRRLAVFVGGFSEESARSMFARDMHVDVDRILKRLVATSLIAKEPSCEVARYRMLETTREYLLAMLEQLHETDAARRDHAQMMVALAQEARSSYARMDTHAWLERFSADEANVRAALDWSLERMHDPSAGAWLVAHWTPYATAVGGAIEHRRWITKAFAAAGSDELLRAELHAAAATSVFGAAAGDIEEHARLAYQYYNGLGDRLSTARAQRVYGTRLAEAGNFDRAKLLLLSATEILEREGNALDIAQAYYSCSELYGFESREQEAQTYAERALAIARRSGFHTLAAAALSQISYFAFAQGDFVRSATLSREARALFKKQGAHNHATLASLTIGQCEYRLDNIRSAAAEFADALQWSNILGDRWLLATTLEVTSTIAATLGHDEVAARLLGGGSQLLESVAIRRPLAQQAFDAICAAVRSRLGATEFDRVYGEGAMLSIPALSAMAGEMTSRAFVRQDASAR